MRCRLGSYSFGETYAVGRYSDAAGAADVGEASIQTVLPISSSVSHGGPTKSSHSNAHQSRALRRRDGGRDQVGASEAIGPAGVAARMRSSALLFLPVPPALPTRAGSFGESFGSVTQFPLVHGE